MHRRSGPGANAPFGSLRLQSVRHTGLRREPGAGLEPPGQERVDDLADPGSARRACGRKAGRVLGRGPEPFERHPGLAGPRRSHVLRPATQPADLVVDQVEPLALNELHGVVADVPLAADLEHRHDVGVMQPRGGAGLAAESLEHPGVAGDLPGQHLERNPTAERDLLGLVHHAHTAVADLAEDPVVAHLSERRGGRSSRLGLVLGPFQPHVLGLLQVDQRREQSQDVGGQLGVAVGVFFQARPFDRGGTAPRTRRRAGRAGRSSRSSTRGRTPSTSTSLKAPPGHPASSTERP